MRRARSDHGQVLVLIAVALTGVLGITALAIDGAYMYDKRNRLYAAADAGAKSGAIEVRRDSTISLGDLKNFADQQAKAHGLTPVACGATGGASVCVNHPPSFDPSSPFNGKQEYVEVIVSEPTSTFFGKILGWLSATPGARAVAGTAGGPDCIVTFDHITFSSPSAGSTLTMPNCGMVIGTSASTGGVPDLDNRATIVADTIGVFHTGTTEGCKQGCTYTDGNGATHTVAEGVPAPSDPLKDLPPLGNPISGTPPCTSQYAITTSQTISVTDYDKYYCGWAFNGSPTLTLNAGNYYINGAITDSGGGTDVTIVGTGVMLFLTAGNGRIQLTNSNHVSLGDFSTNQKLSAPTSGAYKGILIYQDRGAAVDNHLTFGKNNTDVFIEGTIYAKNGTLVMKNQNSHSMTNPCTLIVAYGIEVDKPSFVLDNSCAGFGGSPLLSLTLAE